MDWPRQLSDRKITDGRDYVSHLFICELAIEMEGPIPLRIIIVLSITHDNVELIRQVIKYLWKPPVQLVDIELSNVESVLTWAIMTSGIIQRAQPPPKVVGTRKLL